MALHVEMVTIDCSDPATLAGWWAQHFGGTTHDLLAEEFTVVTLSDGLQLGFQKVPDPTPGKTACTWILVPRTSRKKCRG